MRFINVARRNLSQSNLRQNFTRQNFTELWKLATTSPINKSISKTKEEMSVVISSNLEPLFSKIYSNIEEIIKKEYYPGNDTFHWRKNENVTPQIIHWIYDIDISLAQKM